MCLWGEQGSSLPGPKNELTGQAFIVLRRKGERVPAFRPGLCGLNFPLGQRRRPPAFLSSLPRSGTQRVGGIRRHESCWQSHIKKWSQPLYHSQINYNPGQYKPTIVQYLRNTSMCQQQEPEKAVINPKSFRCGCEFDEQEFPRGRTRTPEDKGEVFPRGQIQGLTKDLISCQGEGSL